MIEGGRLVYSPILNSDEIQGGKKVIKKVEPIELIIINLSEFIDNTTQIIDGQSMEDVIYPSLYMDDVQYWRLLCESLEDYR